VPCFDPDRARDPKFQRLRRSKLTIAYPQRRNAHGANGMGLIRAAVGAIGGTLAVQWKDFLTVPVGIGPTAALLPAAPAGTNEGGG
jgi:hypothetical protein